MDRTYLRSISGFLYMRTCFYFWVMNVISGLAAIAKVGCKFSEYWQLKSCATQVDSALLWLIPHKVQTDYFFIFKQYIKSMRIGFVFVQGSWNKTLKTFNSAVLCIMMSWHDTPIHALAFYLLVPLIGHPNPCLMYVCWLFGYNALLAVSKKHRDARQSFCHCKWNLLDFYSQNVYCKNRYTHGDQCCTLTLFYLATHLVIFFNQ